jgi:hypothetical protein
MDQTGSEGIKKRIKESASRYRVLESMDPMPWQLLKNDKFCHFSAKKRVLPAKNAQTSIQSRFSEPFETVRECV